MRPPPLHLQLRWEALSIRQMAVISTLHVHMPCLQQEGLVLCGRVVCHPHLRRPFVICLAPTCSPAALPDADRLVAARAPACLPSALPGTPQMTSSGCAACRTARGTRTAASGLWGGLFIMQMVSGDSGALSAAILRAAMLCCLYSGKGHCTAAQLSHCGYCPAVRISAAPVNVLHCRHLLLRAQPRGEGQGSDR